MDYDNDKCGTIRHSVRIRFTINNNINTGNQTSDTSRHRSDPASSQDAEHRHHSSITRQDETSPNNREIGNLGVDHKVETKRSFKFIEPQNHKSALFVNLGARASSNSGNQNQKSEKQLFISPELNQTSNLTCISPISPPTPDSTFDTSSYELIDWEEEKKAIEKEREEGENDHRTRDCNYFLDKTLAEVEDRDKMSQSCNFISWVSATRNRASSAAPSIQSNVNDTNREGNVSASAASTISSTTSARIEQAERRASSTERLATLELPGTSLLASNRSTSANHLAIGASVETVCGSDQTQTNAASRPGPRKATAQPLEVEIDSPQMDQLVSPFSTTSHPVSLDDILKIDMDNLRFEEECQALEAEAQYWEQKVEDLERRQFAEDVPRTLVDSIIKHRKELRDLEHEIYKRALDSEESDALSCDGKLSQNMFEDISPSDLQSPTGHRNTDANMYYMNDVSCISNQLVEDMSEGLSLTDTRSPSKYGSRLKPGEENTAHVLNVVPPSGPLQRRQYLSKASSGTDSSEYSQLPMFNQHGHKIIRHHQIDYLPHDEEHFVVEDQKRRKHGQHQHLRLQQHVQSSSSQHQHRVSRRHVQHQHRHQHQQLSVQVNNPETSGGNNKHLVASQHHRARASPIRPDHFKGEFRPHQVAALDSSSTASSSSPQ